MSSGGCFLEMTPTQLSLGVVAVLKQPSLCPPSLAVTGVLKGYDQLLNLVLDEATEYLRGAQGVFCVVCFALASTGTAAGAHPHT